MPAHNLFQKFINFKICSWQNHVHVFFFWTLQISICCFQLVFYSFVDHINLKEGTMRKRQNLTHRLNVQMDTEWDQHLGKSWLMSTITAKQNGVQCGEVNRLVIVNCSPWQQHEHSASGNSKGMFMFMFMFMYVTARWCCNECIYILYICLYFTASLR